MSSDSTESGAVAPTDARSAATPGRRHAVAIPAMRRSAARSTRSAARRLRPPATGCHSETPTGTWPTMERRSVAADVVGVRPLAQHAAGRQTRLRHLEELAGEQRRDAGHPRIRRLRHDDVVLLAAEQEVGTAVADHQAGAPGSARAWWFSASKKREASTTSGEISSTSARSSAWVSAEPSVTPLPRPRMAAVFGAGCSSSGTCASIRCVSMSPAFEASTLPSIASDVVPASRRTATVPVAPSR